ncbi:MAG: lamin tail domain-containing protein [Saprospiraceae bacterium]
MNQYHTFKRIYILSNCGRKDRVSLIIRDKIFLVLIVFLSIFHQNCLFSQYEQDFSSNSWNEGWAGDVSNFTVTDNMLQLKTSNAGSSYIYRSYTMPKDSIEIGFYLKMAFAPSGDNYSKIYLILDNPIESQANGYYIKVGENGSNDALMLYKLVNGVSTLMATGTLGSMASDPADVWVQCKIYRDGYWDIRTNYVDGSYLETDLAFSDASLFAPDNAYFGIFANYTSTRADKFFYDDLVIRTIVKDSIAPTLVDFVAIDDTQLSLSFSEPITEASAKDVENYIIQPGNIKPKTIQYSLGTPNSVVLDFDKNTLQSGILYTLNVSGLRDYASNVSALQYQNFVLAVKPALGDLLISEVLSDPYTGGKDFLELYNNSTKFLTLDGLVIRNSQKNESKVITSKSILYPGEYIAVTEDTLHLKDTYKPNEEARFLETDLPSFNIDAANFSIISTIENKSITLDSFDYSQELHYILLDNTKGVSLEKINLFGQTNDANNWHSAAANVLFATPGYKNSNDKTSSVGVNEVFSPDITSISPNGDGFEDFVSFNYNLSKSGFLATMKLYDPEGSFIGDIQNNTLLGTSGFIKWDGTIMDFDRLRTGIYVVFSRFFHPDGDVMEFKHAIVIIN